MDPNINIEVLLHYHTIFCDDRMSIIMVNRSLNAMTWLKYASTRIQTRRVISITFAEATDYFITVTVGIFENNVIKLLYISPRSVYLSSKKSIPPP